MNKAFSIVLAGGALGAFVLALVSLSTAAWVIVLNGSVGLWQACTPIACTTLPDVSTYLDAVRAFHLMGVITLPVALGAAIYLCLGKGEGKTVNLVFYAFAAAGVFFMISMSVFTAEGKRRNFFSYGFSYALGWVAFALSVIMSVVAKLSCGCDTPAERNVE